MLNKLILKFINEKQLKKNNNMMIMMTKWIEWSRSKNNWNKKKKNENKWCNHCERSIHNEKNCWIKHSEKRRKDESKDDKDSDKTDEKDNNKKEKLNNSKNFKNNSKSNFSLIIIYIIIIITENFWLADFKISCHICKNWWLFEIYTQLNKFIFIMKISSQINIVNEDFIILQFSFKNEKHENITLNDVIYILNAAINLFSVNVAAEKEVWLDIIINELIWVTDSLIIDYALRHNELYSIQLKS